MEENNLETLLRRWAELEPERCRLDTATNDLGVMLRDNWKKGLTFMGEPDLERIQGAVQEAIEARGWNWGVEYGTVGYNACIFDALGPVENMHTPAEALLTAYIIAIDPST